MYVPGYRTPIQAFVPQGGVEGVVSVLGTKATKEWKILPCDLVSWESVCVACMLGVAERDTSLSGSNRSLLHFRTTHLATPINY